MEYYHLSVVIITLIFSAFFSGTEIAFISSSKLQIELDAKQGRLGGKILSPFVKNPSRLINAALIGNTIALVVYGIYIALLLEPWISGWLPEQVNSVGLVMVFQTVISTIIVLFTAEFTPKSIFLLNPNRSLNLLAIPIWIIFWPMTLIAWPIAFLSKKVIIYVLRQEYSIDRPVFGLTDLSNYIQRNTREDIKEANIELDTKIFNNALEFKTVKVRECMIPRTELSAIDIDDDIDELKEEFIESGHSKVLIYKNNSIDEIIGYCHVLELFKKPKEIESILTPVVIVPETTLANELMIQFIQERKSLALVVDEFGGTSGIVTLEDVIEEIFGEIQDEHDDDEDWVEQKITDGRYKLSARHEVDYLNDKYGWGIPEGDYDTLGGFILSVTESIPHVNDLVQIPPFEIRILTMDDARIDNVMFSVENTQQP